MMNFSMSRRTTTTCYALLSVLLVASFALVVTPVNTKNKNRMANTMPEDGDNNKVIINKRLLTEESNKLTFSRNYIAVTKAADFVTTYPNGGDTADFLLDFDDKKTKDSTFTSNSKFPIQGSSTIHKGMLC